MWEKINKVRRPKIAMLHGFAHAQCGKAYPLMGYAQ